VLHRFINADEAEYSAMSAFSVNGTNLFAYCQNNPVSYGDENGEWLHILVGAVVGAVVGVVGAVVSGGDVVDAVIGGVAGAASGALAASGLGVVAQAVGSAAISMASNAGQQVNKIVKGKQNGFNVGDMLVDGAIGLACGMWGGNGASHGNAAGIKSAGKKLLKNLTSPQAWRYYATQAHRAGGGYVLKELGVSLLKNTVGTAASTIKNRMTN